MAEIVGRQIPSVQQGEFPLPESKVADPDAIVPNTDTSATDNDAHTSMLMTSTSASSSNASDGQSNHQSNHQSNQSEQTEEENPDFLFTGGKKVKFDCNYCNKDITTQFRIRCADPACIDFDLCADCFSAGVQLLPHKNTHDYRIVDCMERPLFSKDW